MLEMFKNSTFANGTLIANEMQIYTHLQVANIGILNLILFKRSNPNRNYLIYTHFSCCYSLNNNNKDNSRIVEIRNENEAEIKKIYMWKSKCTIFFFN